MKFLHTADSHIGERLPGSPLVEVQHEAMASIIRIVEREAPAAAFIVADDGLDNRILKRTILARLLVTVTERASAVSPRIGA